MNLPGFDNRPRFAEVSRERLPTCGALGTLMHSVHINAFPANHPLSPLPG
jgi:hypothetical protein